MHSLRARWVSYSAQQQKRTLGEASAMVHQGRYYFYFNNWGNCPGVDCCNCTCSLIMNMHLHCKICCVVFATFTFNFLITLFERQSTHETISDFCWHERNVMATHWCGFVPCQINCLFICLWLSVWQATAGCASCCFNSFKHYLPGCENHANGSDPYVSGNVCRWPIRTYKFAY